MQEVVLALIFNHDGKVLAVSRKDNPNAFGLIGGKVESGETLSQALIREVKEETGLTCVNGYAQFEPNYNNAIFSEYDSNKYLCHTFSVHTSGEINLTESGVVAWVDKQVLIDGPFGDYNKKLFSEKRDIDKKTFPSERVLKLVKMYKEEEYSADEGHEKIVLYLAQPENRNDLYELYCSSDDSYDLINDSNSEFSGTLYDYIETAADLINLGGEDEISDKDEILKCYNETFKQNN